LCIVLSKFHKKYVWNFKNKLYNYITINIHRYGITNNLQQKVFKLHCKTAPTFSTNSFQKASFPRAKAYINFLKSYSPNKGVFVFSFSPFFISFQEIKNWMPSTVRSWNHLSIIFSASRFWDHPAFGSHESYSTKVTISSKKHSLRSCLFKLPTQLLGCESRTISNLQAFKGCLFELQLF
jgi:hypothetical protein